ncbi:hypothetical protein KDX31_12660 [Amphritea atlantica]|uniref:Uncharacterized protein n=1 Tax=Amphritea atlantica TaxID=355243 RepID=A0ABY5GSR3_9GAMM|nr:hypothetical protein KDX31_12660 [Amphritea atlantica]
MTNDLEIEWKVSGLLPVPIGDDGKYYIKRLDENYSKRTFCRQENDVLTYSLEPTKLFHQALGAELRKTYEINFSTNRFPYSIQLGEQGPMNIGLRLRTIGDRILIISIQLKKFSSNQSIPELIEFQKLSTHPILEAIARFSFNVHYCPNPSKMVVTSWCSKPLLRITPNNTDISTSSLVEIVTRHTDIGERAIAEMLKKNESLNFNDDMLLIDKQGIVFLQKTQDHNNQRNRYQRISSLFEYALYVKSFVDSIGLLKESSDVQEELPSEIAVINSVLGGDVLNESVSASRGWDLMKKEMSLGEISLESSELESMPFYKRRCFLAISAIVALASGIFGIAGYFKGGE